jgi:hypothetical protein
MVKEFPDRLAGPTSMCIQPSRVFGSQKREHAKKVPKPGRQKTATEPACHAMSRRPDDEAAIGVDALSG